MQPFAVCFVKVCWSMHSYSIAMPLSGAEGRFGGFCSSSRGVALVERVPCLCVCAWNHLPHRPNRCQWLKPTLRYRGKADQIMLRLNWVSIRRTHPNTSNEMLQMELSTCMSHSRLDGSFFICFSCVSVHNSAEEMITKNTLVAYDAFDAWHFHLFMSRCVNIAFGVIWWNLKCRDMGGMNCHVTLEGLHVVGGI